MQKLFGALGPALNEPAAATHRQVSDAPGAAGRPDAVVTVRASNVEARCTAPGLVTSDDLIVAIRGRPFWRGEAEKAADAPFAAEILRLYRAEGVRLLQRLHGSFALAILDTRRNEAVLAIDRMGIERLAYVVNAGLLVFGTSAEAVARTCGRPLRLDHDGIFNYLFFHMVPSPKTVFDGVRKLPGGHALEFHKGKIRTAPYWRAEVANDGPADFADLSRELHESLRNAVRAARPDASTGAFLSGGLDSSTVAGVLAEVGPAPTRTFSIGFGFPDYDELSYARIANKRFGCQGHEYTVHGSDIARTFPLIARAYDEPYGNSSALPAFHCAQLAKQSGVNHLLAGDGGDELFAGNTRYAEQSVFEWYKLLPAPIRTGLIEPTLVAIPPSVKFWPVRKARGYVSKATVPLPARLESWNFVVALGPASILHGDFLDSIDPQSPFSHMQQIWDAAPCASTLDRMLRYDWRITLADNDLRKVETMCEQAGIAVSYPMLHPDVVDLSCRIPPKMQMAHGRLRHFYKKSMTGFLPHAIINKKKHGFGLPFGLWLNESPELRELIRDRLANLRSRRIINPAFIDRLLDLHGMEDARYYGVFVWVIAALEQWLQEHGVST